MKEIDLGIYDGKHDETLTLVERGALEILEGRGKGAEAAISAREFAEELGLGHEDRFGTYLPDREQKKRDIRRHRRLRGRGDKILYDISPARHDRSRKGVSWEEIRVC